MRLTRSPQAAASRKMVWGLSSVESGRLSGAARGAPIASPALMPHKARRVECGGCRTSRSRPSPSAITPNPARQPQPLCGRAIGRIMRAKRHGPSQFRARLHYSIRPQRAREPRTQRQGRCLNAAGFASVQGGRPRGQTAPSPAARGVATSRAPPSRSVSRCRALAGRQD